MDGKLKSFEDHLLITDKSWNFFPESLGLG